MSERVRLRNQLIETQGLIEVPRDRIAPIIDATQIARMNYEDACSEKYFYDLVMHFRAAIFGSARLQRDTEEFKFVTKLSKALVEARRIDIVTGGGPGVMEAAHYGLVCAQAEAEDNGKKYKAKNVGVRVHLPFEDTANPYIHIETKHENFATRLHAFVTQIKAAYLAPGGIGSLLELTYLMQLKQVGHIEKSFPIIAHSFWRDAVESANKIFYHQRIKEDKVPMIKEEDLDLITFSDDIEEIVALITKEFDFWKRDIRSKVRFIGSVN